MSNRMRVIKSRLIASAPGVARIRVIWEVKHGWFDRLLLSIPEITTLSEIYERRGGVWRCYTNRQPVMPKLERELDLIAEQLVAEVASAH